MAKGDLKIKKKSTEESVSFDPRLSQDKKTFVLVIESTCSMLWLDAVEACLVWSSEELKKYEHEQSATQH